MPKLRELVIEWVVMLAVGVTLAALGPFGSFAVGSFAARLAYWIPAAVLGYLIFRPITLAAILIARSLKFSELAGAVVGTLVAAVPASLAIAFLGGYRPGAEPSFEDLFQLFVQVGLIGVLVTALFVLIGQRSDEAAATDIAPTVPPPSPQREGVPAPAALFLERLPAAWRDRLIALEMEDHYVRAYGPGTSTLILLRMRDAEAELSGIDGLRVHRSWWVARGAVERVLRDGRNFSLCLIGGLEAPVARDRISALKAAGWLD